MVFAGRVFTPRRHLLAVGLILLLAPGAVAGTILDPTPGTGSYTLMPNGGFETGDRTSWTQNVNFSFGVFSISTAEAWSGTYSALTNTKSFTMAAGYAMSTYTYYRPVTPGATYVLSGFLNTAGLTSGNFYLDLWDAPFEPTVGVFGDPTLLGRDWFFAWGEFTVPSTVSSILVRVVRDQQRFITDAGYADEIAVTLKSDFQAPSSLSAVPLPGAAWAGLGMLAALGAMRRFRRRRRQIA